MRYEKVWRRYYIWEGFEAEGKIKGLKTLFVRGDCPLSKFFSFISSIDYEIYEQIYFGAGGKNPNFEDVLEMIKRVFAFRGLITVETSDLKTIHELKNIFGERIRAIYYVDSINNAIDVVKVKDNKETFMIEPENRKLYKFDRGLVKV